MKMTTIRKLLCRVGFHDWLTANGKERRCLRCPKHQELVGGKSPYRRWKDLECML